MNKGKITIATCQHEICGDIDINLKAILKQIQIANSHQADIVHFPECNLSGYGGMDVPEINKRDYNQIQNALQKIKKLVRALEIKIIIGSHHFVNEDAKPRNSLLLINEMGEVGERYDKRILTGTDGTMDHLYYSPGKKPVFFMLNGVRCGILICHEWRYPELYREYKKLDVQLVFHSWYDGGLDLAEFRVKGKNEGELIVGSVRGYAANNHIWISGSNTSKRQSCFPAFVVRPDGMIHNKLARNKPGVLISTIDVNQIFEDPCFYGRDVFLG